MAAPEIARRQEVFGAIPDTEGEVTVRALGLTDWLDLSVISQERKFGEIKEALARCVVDDSGNALRTADQWEVWGGQNRKAAMELYAAIDRLSNSEPSEKNESPPS